MVFLNRENTCIIPVYDPTPIDQHITTEAAVRNIHVLSEYLKFRGYLTALYVYVCNTITGLISCHIAYLPIFFICMNNSIHWCINRYILLISVRTW